MNRSSNYDAGAIGDLFAEGQTRRSDRSATIAPCPEAEPDRFLNAYAEASQALAPGVRQGQNNNAAPGDSNSARSEAVDRDRPSLNGCEVANPDEIREDYVPRARAGRSSEQGTRPRLMTAPDVAAYLQTSVSTVWRQAKKAPGFPQPFRIGGSTRWDRLELDRYVDGLVAAGKAER